MRVLSGLIGRISWQVRTGGSEGVNFCDILLKNGAFFDKKVNKSLCFCEKLPKSERFLRAAVFGKKLWKNDGFLQKVI
jgi:hypothetical protein